LSEDTTNLTLLYLGYCATKWQVDTKWSAYSGQKLARRGSLSVTECLNSVCTMYS